MSPQLPSAGVRSEDSEFSKVGRPGAVRVWRAMRKCAAQSSTALRRRLQRRRQVSHGAHGGFRRRGFVVAAARRAAGSARFHNSTEGTAFQRQPRGSFPPIFRAPRTECTGYLLRRPSVHGGRCENVPLNRPPPHGGGYGMIDALELNGAVVAEGGGFFRAAMLAEEDGFKGFVVVGTGVGARCLPT